MRKNQDNNLPKGWRRVKLGEFVKINPSVKLERGQEYPYIDMADIQPFSRVSKWSKRKVYNGSGSRFENGDILFARITPCLEHGKIAQVTNLDGPAFGSTEFFVLRGRRGISDNNFVYYLALAHKVRKTAEQSMIGASGRQRVERDAFENIEVEVPEDINEQKRIAGILSAFDEKIEVNNKINQTLEEIASAIFKKWFVKFRFPGWEKAKFVDSELGKIPEGWRISKIGKEFKTILGGTPSTSRKDYWKNGDIPWINSGALNQFPVIKPTDFITKQGLENSAAKIMPPKTVVVPLVISIGKPVNISILGIESSGNQSVVGIVPNERIPSSFIYCRIKNKKEEIYLQASGGAQQHINKQIIDDTPIIIPNDEIIGKFKNIVEPIYDSIIKNAFENQKLAALRDLLLPKLMSGEMEV